MDYLPAPVLRILEGKIDPQSQHIIERYSQTYLFVLTTISLIASYFASSVILALEILLAGFVILCLVVVPPWPFLSRYPIKFLPIRTTVVTSENKT